MRYLPILALLAVAPVASAQSAGLNAQRFAPAPGGDANYNAVEGADVAGHLVPAFGVFVNYAHDPLVAVHDSDRVDLLKYDLGLDVSAALGFGKHFQLGVDLPVTLLEKAGDSGAIYVPAIASQTLGDLRIEPKIKFFGPHRGGLALSVPISVPTGSPADYHGEAGVTVEPRLIGELPVGERLRLGANLGYLIRSPQSVYSLTQGNELIYGVGAEFRAVPDRFSLLAEVYGGAALGPDADLTIQTAPLEGDLAARLYMGASALTLGGGPGITIGYGTPTWRVFVGYTFTPKAKVPPPDRDGDGLVDSVDKCPDEPEDKDNFQDEDGCPDPDNDGDGIADTADKCPNDPEDKDSFQDEDGCPDPDNDGDGLADTADKCPNEPETKNDYQDEDGCPDTRPEVKIVKQEIKFDKVYFDTDKDTLKPESKDLLKVVADMLKEHPELTLIKIGGHTDNTSTPAHNLDLSKRRAASVRAFLVEQGIDAKRLKSEGFGQTRPIDTNATPEGREKNRRVQFTILEVSGKPFKPGMIPTSGDEP